jgi:hypothetical protein
MDNLIGLQFAAKVRLHDGAVEIDRCTVAAADGPTTVRKTEATVVAPIARAAVGTISAPRRAILSLGLVDAVVLAADLA